MQIIVSIIVFIVLFSVLILVHEFGHFWMAKRAGVRVDEFGMGLPPRIWGKKKGDTLYSINWIPFGGFVRLFGEDPTEHKALKAKDSFLTKSLWQRSKIVLGGVVMNFLLAWLLLTFGLMVGIEPLIVDYDQFKDYAEDGKVAMSPYHVVKDFGGKTDKIKVSKGDYILAINGQGVGTIDNLDDFVEGVDDDEVSVKIRRFNNLEEPLRYQAGIGSIDSKYVISKEEFKDFTFYPVAKIPRIMVLKDSEMLQLKAGDQILRVDGKEQLGRSNFLEAIYSGRVRNIDVLRDNKFENIKLDLAASRTRVDKLIPGMPAEVAGVQLGDIFVSIEGNSISEPQEVQYITQKTVSMGDGLTYVFDRNGETIDLKIQPQEGMVGVGLTSVIATQGIDLEFYETFVASSILEIEKEKVGLLAAPFKAFVEIKNVSILTAKMTTRVLGGIFRAGEVPEGVAGPVGIAQMTYVSVQGGFMDVIRFAAILSLSLGVLNVLPFPALDGGRFAFILFEAITGKKLDQKFEAMIHALGFAILLLVIGIITWNDIARLISG